MLVGNLRSALAAVNDRAESNSLLEGDVANKDRVVESSRLGSRKVSR